MTIKEKLQSIKHQDEFTMAIKYSDIFWNITQNDLFLIYENDNDYKSHKPLVSCEFKDIQNINQDYLKLDFDFFFIEKPNPILNILNLCFILHKDSSIERGIKTGIEYR